MYNNKQKNILFLSNLCLAISGGWEFLAFNLSAKYVQYIQERLLKQILKDNHHSFIGNKYNFKNIKTVEDFKNSLPLTEYEFYVPYIKEIEAGKKAVLTREDVLLLEPSSGTTSATKFIPYTKSLKLQFQRAVGAWMFDLYANYKKMLNGSAYWSITPNSTDLNSQPASKVRKGFEDDSEYLGRLGKYFTGNIFAVPPEVGKIRNIESFYYATLFYLLQARDLSFISIWSPSIMKLLIKRCLKWLPGLMVDITKGYINRGIDIDPEIRVKLQMNAEPNPERSLELINIILNAEITKGNIFEAIWPDLELISCWADSSSARYLTELKNLFPDVEIQPKGLIATEGIVSFPLKKASGSVLAIRSHFFEFIEVNSNNTSTLLAHELLPYKPYEVIITTGGGLYRYKLNDIIEVIDFYKQVPVIKFIGKADNISNLFGEKINEIHVLNALEKIFDILSINPTFFMLAPEYNPYNDEYFYVLYLETFYTGRLHELKDLLEAELMKNYHYSHCRKLGQLAQTELFVITEEGSQSYIKRCRSRGQKLGDIKNRVLDKDLEWTLHFKGNFV